MRGRIDHSAAHPAVALCFGEPVEVLEARDLAGVRPVLDGAEKAAQRGLHAVGFVSYEAAAAFDPAFPPPRAGALPLAWFGLFESLAPADPLPAGIPTPPPPWAANVDAADFAGAVAEIRESLAAGDTYLVNYSTRFHRRWSAGEDPFDLYCRLVSGYGGGYHAYIETDEWAVACGSPELFLELSHGQLTTRPMKGTAARGRWSAEDEAIAAALAASAKERAQNVMVVDMLRNDLGRIARPGSVTVPSLVQLEQHPSMWQLTSTVAATVQGGLADVFGALFPCASVTGAPKVSTMNIISRLEPEARGLYCGAVGYLAPGPAALAAEYADPVAAPDQIRVLGGARFAVAIRTAVVDKIGGRVEYGAGGGISWDSDPAREWEEVHLKAKALTESGGATTDAFGPGDGLIETMRYEPGRGVRNLGLHLARLTSSARYFGVAVPDHLEGAVLAAVADLPTARRVRAVLGAGRALSIEAPELDAEPDRLLRLCVDHDPVLSGDIGLFHKTTRRRRYDDRARRHPGYDDVVLVNEKGQVTETTRANLAICLDGGWCTPPVGCGLLPGVERHRLLAEGVLVERAVTLADLARAEGTATISSLRGWRAATVEGL